MLMQTLALSEEEAVPREVADVLSEVATEELRSMLLTDADPSIPVTTNKVVALEEAAEAVLAEAEADAVVTDAVATETLRTRSRRQRDSTKI